MVKIVNEPPISKKLSKTQLRALDFLGPRIDFKEEDREKEPQLKTTTRGFDSKIRLTKSPAEYRLQQLTLFRQKQILDRMESAHPAPRALRDIPISGQHNWVPIGPAGVERGQAATGPVVSGRAKGIAVAPGGRRVYIATANGGVWYSGDTGKNWTPLMNGLDYFPSPHPIGVRKGVDSLACGAIALVPGSGNADDRLYVGTGEGDGMTDSYLGVGPLVSDNGGHTWRNETANPTLFGRGFYALAIDPDDPERVVAGTSNGVYIREINRWNKQSLSGRVTGITVAKGRSGKRFFAAVWRDKVYSSSDGVRWSPLIADFPTARVGRIAIAVHPYNPDIIYAQVAYGSLAPGTNASASNPAEGHLLGIYRFDYSRGNKWHKINGAPVNLFGTDLSKRGQGNYDNAIIVAPDNENRIYLGGSTLYSSSSWVASIYRLDLSIAINGVANVAGTNLIGEDVHPDVHGFAFTPNDHEKLWVACDGGIFYSRQAATGVGRIFQHCNKGLQTLTMNYLGKHPTEEEVLFCGAQDNGGLRYIGEDVWLHSLPGDAGYYLANWVSPYTVIDTYTNNSGFRSTKGGNRGGGIAYDYSPWNIPLQYDPGINQFVEFVNFYAPLAQVPAPATINAADPEQQKQANILAFGTQRPWISVDFGLSWLPIPSRTPNNLGQFISDRGKLISSSLISALAFQDSKRLLIGLEDGTIFRYTDISAGNDWSSFDPVENLSAKTGGPLPTKSVRDFALRPGNPEEFYVCFGGIIGGSNGYRHVWHYDGTGWRHRGGNSPARQLLDMHFNALVAADASQLFAGSDVGVWKSDDGGDHWDTFSFGLPETAVMDLQISKRDLGAGTQLILLRASTYGRGVYEYQISPAAPAPAPGVSADIELYLRDHVLDKGRYPTRINIADPRNSGSLITDVNSPDIKIAIPDTIGIYPFAPEYILSPGEFYLDLVDKSAQVPVPSSGRAVSKVYVQVHNRSAFAAQHVYVMLLIHEIDAAGMPQLPADYDASLRAGVPINSDGWQTVGLKIVGGMHAANPKVVTFDLASEFLPDHATTGGGKDLVLVVLLHHVNDTYATNNRILDPGAAGNVILSSERKVAFKHITVQQSNPIPNTVPAIQRLAGFVSIPETATSAGAPYDAFLAQSFRQNDELLHSVFLSALSSPLASSGIDGTPTTLDAGALLNADQINVATDVTLHLSTPLIWRARRRIVISAKINGKGKGAPLNSEGDFGGSGGGSTANPGQKCVLPLSTPHIEIAQSAANSNGENLDEVWASRLPLIIHTSKGGGAGGDDGTDSGGLGGGIVVLCAPVIEFEGSGEIDASGERGAGNAGCGGGGLILLVAGEIIGLRENGPNPNVIVTGGQPTAGSTGKAGGNGLLIQKKIT